MKGERYAEVDYMTFPRVGSSLSDKVSLVQGRYRQTGKDLSLE
jgi:hypothetical protein